MVEVEAGTTYRFDLEGRDTGSGSLRDPVLRGDLRFVGHTDRRHVGRTAAAKATTPPHLDRNVLGQLRRGSPSLDSGPLG